jgi:hypothetical protein
MNAKRFIGGAAVGLLAVIMIVAGSPSVAGAETSPDYSRLLTLMPLAGDEPELYAFSDFDDSFDAESHQANVDFFNDNPQLVHRIQQDLNEKTVKWELNSLSHRLLYVPETRTEFAHLFMDYCRKVIDDILGLTEMANPYAAIRTPTADHPAAEANDEGITVFLVQDLTKEYVAKYIFSGEDKKKVAIKLTGTLESTEIGSYSSYIMWQESDTIGFLRNQHTVWQTRAHNPYTVLMVPVEETLHIGLRTNTENAIRKTIQETAPGDIAGVRKIVDDWISVEEAIVGGLVNVLLPPVLERYGTPVPAELIDADLKSKGANRKYRLLQRGIEVVREMGYKTSIELYREHPFKFREMLI